jgi:hypothetical protein
MLRFTGHFIGRVLWDTLDPGGVTPPGRLLAVDVGTRSAAPDARLSSRLPLAGFRDSLDEEQVPERKFDGLSLARAKQQPCGSRGPPLLNQL